MHRALPVFLLVLAGLGASAEAPPVPSPDPLAPARAAYEERARPARAAEALDLFERASRTDARSYEARWEGARAAYMLGEWTLAERPEKERLAVFQRGIDLARAAVSLRPDGPEGHFWLGVLLGVYGEAKGIFKALGMVPDIRKEMDACLRLDPSVECYGPHRVLGRLYFKLPGFKGGDNEKSLEHLRKAVEGCPTNALARLYYAETLKAEGQKDAAREQLRTLLSSAADPRWAPEQPAIRDRAQRLLKKLGG